LNPQISVPSFKTYYIPTYIFCNSIFLPTSADDYPKKRGLSHFWGDFGDALHIFTSAFRARPKEHRVDIEPEDSKRCAAVIDILGREG
jgi:hypothetical protein